MAPEAGKTLLHYRFVEKIGEGGMGVVWKAFDTKLNRDVAIKILETKVAADTERLARFEREARSLAALNHPNVAQVHGLERADGTHFLVMELVPGEDLAQRVARGPLPQAEALDICAQIAAGLEAAHERGIVHRDLKPANVRLTPEGVVKVLDFGLAKTVEETASPAGNPSLSPTVTSSGTLAGRILGTAAYMSPEQARGAKVDKRTDVWAFGCVMLELLGGSSPFLGATVPDTLAKVLELEPDLGSLPADTPTPIVNLIRRCLRKDARRRLRDIGDAALEIEDCMQGANEARDGGRVDRGGKAWQWVAALAIIVAAAGWWLVLIGEKPAAGHVRGAVLSVSLPEGVTVNHGELPSIDISPDGRWIVFVGTEGDGSRLYLRAIDSHEVKAIVDTEDAVTAFFSPDSRWIGFLQGNVIKKVAVSGGVPLRVSVSTPVVRGFKWTRPDRILMTPSKQSGLYSVSVDDGTFEELSVVDGKVEQVHNWTQPLPGRSRLLITVVPTDARSYDDARIEVFDPADGSRKILTQGGYAGRLLPGGILVYVRGGELLAVRVDTDRWETVGPVTQVLGEIMTDANTGSASFGLAMDGTLVYVPGEIYAWQSGRLVWVDRFGNTEPVIEESRPFRYPSISPDGTRALLSIEEINDDIWIYEFNRGALARITFGNRNIFPIWRRGTDDICYSAVGQTDRAPQMYLQSTNDGSEPRRVFEHEEWGFCNSFTPDGSTMTYMHFAADGGQDVKKVDLETGDATPLIDTRFEEHSSRISPDGKWIAYVSDESGQHEVYLQPLSGRGGKKKVSTAGGIGPTWHRAGTELFYVEGTRMMAVPIRLGPEVTIGQAQSLFEGDFSMGRLDWISNYDVSPDGKRFLMIVRDPVPEIREIRVVQNWFDDVEAKLVAAGD